MVCSNKNLPALQRSYVDDRLVNADFRPILHLAYTTHQCSIVPLPRMLSKHEHMQSVSLLLAILARTTRGYTEQHATLVALHGCLHLHSALPG